MKLKSGHTSQAIINSDDRWEEQIIPDTRSRLSARDSEIAQALWSSVGTTDVHLLRSLIVSRRKRNHSGLSYQRIRVTIDQTQSFEAELLAFLIWEERKENLYQDDFVIMEIKGSGQEPKWLKRIFQIKYRTGQTKFSRKMAVGIAKSGSLDYAPKTSSRNGRCCLCLILFTISITQ